MLIADLNYLESVAEETIVGGRRRRRRTPKAFAEALASSEAIGSLYTDSFTESYTQAVAGLFSSSFASSYSEARGD